MALQRSSPGQRKRASAALVIPLFLTLVLLVLVAIATRPVTGGLFTGGQRHSISLLLDVIFFFFALLALAGSILLAIVLTPNRKRKKGDDEWDEVVELAPLRWQTVLIIVMIWLAVLLFLLLLVLKFLPNSFLGAPGGAVSPPLPKGVLPALPPSMPAAASMPPQGPPGLPPVLVWTVLLVLGLLFVFLVARALWIDLRRRMPKDQPAAADAVTEILEEGIDALRRETDPRRAVVRAYARIEAEAGHHGLPRRRHEAPFEFLQRLVNSSIVAEGPLHRLTTIFELARFSPHPMGVEYKDEAIELLQAVQREIAANAEAVAAREEKVLAR
ncbi:MAG: DUF4129 domain-containing protein [Chloroflexi bacterium]|nr:DUF4129 domain-containing protein [Chloroflexota bacterium]